jgi:uncharacterized protein (TIGR02217 family)
MADGFIEEELLVACPAYTFQGGPSFSTRLVALANGREKRNQNWSRPRQVFKAPFQNIDEDAVFSIRSAFYAARGMANGFLFKDWTDFQAKNAEIGLAPAGSAPVQLVKPYFTLGGQLYNRAIVKPKADGFVLKQAGVTKAGTLDTTTGLFTPSTAWTTSAILTWSGEFYVPVRFDQDDLPFTLDNPGRLNGDVALIELFL